MLGTVWFSIHRYGDMHCFAGFGEWVADGNGNRKFKGGRHPQLCLSRNALSWFAKEELSVVSRRNKDQIRL